MYVLFALFIVYLGTVCEGLAESSRGDGRCVMYSASVWPCAGTWRSSQVVAGMRCDYTTWRPAQAHRASKPSHFAWLMVPGIASHSQYLGRKPRFSSTAIRSTGDLYRHLIETSHNRSLLSGLDRGIASILYLRYEMLLFFATRLWMTLNT